MTRILALGIISLICNFSIAQKLLPFEVQSKRYINLKNADSLFEVGDYLKAQKYFQKSSSIIGNFPMELYKFSICLWISKDSMHARSTFKKAFNRGFYFTELSYLEQSPFIKELLNSDSLYSILNQRVYRDSLCLYPEYREKLLKLKEFDQAQRVVNSVSNDIFKFNDSLNRAELTIILDDIQWPGFNEVGYMGEGASFLIAQHSDNDIAFQRKCLLLMREQFLLGNISISSYAMIIDRYLINIGESQLFGTQLIFNENTNSFELKKCKYPSEIDFLRSLFLLMPVKDYVTLMNKKNTNPLEKK
jgi:tetratricopeptide (TPR) repeat protein